MQEARKSHQGSDEIRFHPNSARQLQYLEKWQSTQRIVHFTLPEAALQQSTRRAGRPMMEHCQVVKRFHMPALHPGRGFSICVRPSVRERNVFPSNRGEAIFAK